MKKYLVELTAEERSQLVALTRKGKASARRIKRALVLIDAAAGDKDEDIASKVCVRNIQRIRERFVEKGLEAALSELPRPGKARLQQPPGSATHRYHLHATTWPGPVDDEAPRRPPG